MGDAISRVGASNWFTVLGSTASALSGSPACPSVTFEVDFMETSFDLFEAACSYMEPHYGLWTTIMQIAWAFLAIRVFLKSGGEG